jgi:DNA-binding HxlR family transcriptional regulator
MEVVSSSEVKEESCPIARFLGVLDGRWATLIVRELLAGERRFGELSRALDGVSPKTLTGRLRQLERAGLVERTVFAEVPPRVTYCLTEGGQALRPVLDEMADWATKWLPSDIARPTTVRRTPRRVR